MRIFTVLVGAIFILSGVWCFSHPGLNFPAIVFPLGIVMILAGINAALDFVVRRKQEGLSALRLTEGILLILAGIFLIQDLLFRDDMFIMFFSMWILFMGCIRCVMSLTLIKRRIRTWFVTLAIGIVSIAAGLHGLFHLTTDGMTMVLLIGGFIILYG
ncbi:MAG: DUF308 domain-containing protein, partial [Firmicutes bacterium]|nr:DUF308 domain-containing protein [Bacillota bacterium]